VFEVRNVEETMKASRMMYFSLSVLVIASSIAATASENRSANVAGKWELSWEARLRTERGTIQLEQIDSKLAGTYEGRLGSPQVSGDVEGQNIILKLEFQGGHPYALVFKGTVAGDRMQGKFDVQGVAAGYDSHEENAHPTDYSWTAVRRPNRVRP
jgi:autotransporter translocation and assembly factor TamB